MIESKKLKCAKEPERTAIRAYHLEKYAATIRYGDEKGIEINDTLKLIRSENETLIGYAKVVKTKEIAIWKAMDFVRKSNALYSLEYSEELLSTLNGYYQHNLNPLVKVKVIIYKVFQLA